MTGEDMIFELWRRCRVTAQEAGTVSADAVQQLIGHTREILTEYNCPKPMVDGIFLNLYTVVHWDWPEPTARIFETLLEIELAEYFRERMVH